MNHQHGIEKTYNDEELKGSITRKELPMPMGWKVLIQPNQSKSKTDSFSSIIPKVCDKTREVLLDTPNMLNILKEAGVELGFVENYLRNTYKIPMIGFGKRKAKKEFLKVLKENPTTRDFAEEILDNILSNNNVVPLSEV